MTDTITRKEMAELIEVSEGYVKILIRHRGFPLSIGEESVEGGTTRKLYPREAFIEWAVFTGRYDPVVERALKRIKGIGKKCECCIVMTDD